MKNVLLLSALAFSLQSFGMYPGETKEERKSRELSEHTDREVKRHVELMVINRQISAMEAANKKSTQQAEQLYTDLVSAAKINCPLNVRLVFQQQPNLEYAIAFIMRRYFDDEFEFVQQVKLAKHISELMEVEPVFRKIPFHVVMKAVEIGTIYGASYGFQVLYSYLEKIYSAKEGLCISTTAYWHTNFAAVTEWANLITLAESLKFLALPHTVNGSCDIDLITDAQNANISKYSNGSERNDLLGSFVDSIGKKTAKHTVRFGDLSGAYQTTNCIGIGFVSNLKLAEYINKLTLVLPQPQDLEVNLCGKNITIPAKVLKNFAVTGALYGYHYAVPLIDEYLLAEYGVISDDTTRFIWSSIENFSDNIKAMIEEDEEEPSIEESDIELARYPEEQ